jgi:hypothetical protein
MNPEQSLPPAPRTVADSAGVPSFGTYEGALTEVDLRTLRAPHARGRLGRLLHRKRWVYAFASDEEVSVLAAIVDTTYASTAFVMVTDMRSGQVVVDRSIMGGPSPLTTVSDRPAHGLAAAFRSPVGTWRLSREPGADAYYLSIEARPVRAALRTAVDAVRSASRALRSGGSALPVGGGPLRPAAGQAAGRPDDGTVSIALSFHASSTPELSVVAPVELGGGSVNVTMKAAGLPVTGTVTAGGRTWTVDSAVGGLDYTHGYLARHTAWNWAFMTGRLADGRRIGLNLVEGFNESRDDVNENGLWIDDRLIPLDRARFTFDRTDPHQQWTVRTVDGSVDLRFTPLAVHSERKDLVVISSRFIQPVGRFTGTVRIDGVDHEVSDIPGVTEDQDIRW